MKDNRLVKSKKGEKCHIIRPHEYWCYCGYGRDGMGNKKTIAAVDSEDICDVCEQAVGDANRCNRAECSNIVFDSSYCIECKSKNIRLGKAEVKISSRNKNIRLGEESPWKQFTNR